MIYLSTGRNVRLPSRRPPSPPVFSSLLFRQRWFKIAEAGGGGAQLQEAMRVAPGEIDIAVQGFDGGGLGFRQGHRRDAGNGLVAEGEGGIRVGQLQAHGQAQQGGGLVRGMEGADAALGEEAVVGEEQEAGVEGGGSRGGGSRGDDHAGDGVNGKHGDVPFLLAGDHYRRRGLDRTDGAEILLAAQDPEGEREVGALAPEGVFLLIADCRQGRVRQRINAGLAEKAPGHAGTVEHEKSADQPRVFLRMGAVTDGREAEGLEGGCFGNAAGGKGEGLGALRREVLRGEVVIDDVPGPRRAGVRLRLLIRRDEKFSGFGGVRQKAQAGAEDVEYEGGLDCGHRDSSWDETEGTGCLCFSQ